MEGNETLHTSHLQCHIFIPLIVFPLPASASHQQHPSVDKRKDLLPVLHPAFLLKGENLPSVLLCHAFASAVPPPTPLPISACLITWSAQPIKSIVLHLPSLYKNSLHTTIHPILLTFNHCPVLPKANVTIQPTL